MKTYIIAHQHMGLTIYMKKVEAGNPSEAVLKIFDPLRQWVLNGISENSDINEVLSYLAGFEVVCSIMELKTGKVWE